MCARCLNEGMFIPGAKRSRRKAQSVEVPSVMALNVESALNIQSDNLPEGLNLSTGGNQLTSTWLTPFPLVINLTLSVTVLIVNLFLMKDVDSF
jgi:hypothetical protein